MSQSSLQELFNKLAQLAKNEALEGSGMIGLGELDDLLAYTDQDAPVLIQHDGELRQPGDLESYRGYYTDLSFDLVPSRESVQTVEDVRADIDQYLYRGKAYIGYKGGEFYANPSTLVWASYYSTCDGTGVTGVTTIDGTVVITTAKVD